VRVEWFLALKKEHVMTPPHISLQKTVWILHYFWLSFCFY
jgi:hypothetical protein